MTAGTGFLDCECEVLDLNRGLNNKPFHNKWGLVRSPATMNNNDGSEATPPAPLIPPEVLQQLRDSTSGTPIELERLAAQIRTLILAAPSADDAADANAGVPAPAPNAD